MTRGKREKSQGRREGGLFVPLPLNVLQSENFRTLSPRALKLFFLLLAQLEIGTGGPRNNGNLCAAHSVVGGFGGLGSKETLTAAKRELLERGWIEQTRHGGLHKRADLFAITIWAINDCGGKLEVPCTSTPSSLWRKWQPEKTDSAVRKIYLAGTETVPEAPH